MAKTLAELQAEVEALKARNTALEAEKAQRGTLTFAVSKDRTVKVNGKDEFRKGSGAIIVYGLGRNPTTLYAEQWDRLLARASDLKVFIDAHRDEADAIAKARKAQA